MKHIRKYEIFGRWFKDKEEKVQKETPKPVKLTHDDKDLQEKIKNHIFNFITDVIKSATDGDVTTDEKYSIDFGYFNHAVYDATFYIRKIRTGVAHIKFLENHFEVSFTPVFRGELSAPKSPEKLRSMFTFLTQYNKPEHLKQYYRSGHKDQIFTFSYELIYHDVRSFECRYSHVDQALHYINIQNFNTFMKTKMFDL